MSDNYIRTPMLSLGEGGLTPVAPVPTMPTMAAQLAAMKASPWWQFYRVAGIVAGALGIYHGYKRNGNSIGWAIGWSAFGGTMPFFALPLMWAQGFGKPSTATRALAAYSGRSLSSNPSKKRGKRKSRKGKKK